MEAAPVVVVGAGFGGLAAAVELAAGGAQVVVVEQSSAPGGKARTAMVAGRPIDVGPTVLTMRWVFDALFARAGRSLEAYVTLHPSDVVARHAWGDGSRLDLYSDVERSAAAIAAFSSAAEADAYRRFAARGKAVADLVRGPFLESERPSLTGMVTLGARVGLRQLAQIDAHRTMWKSLASTFRDPRLQALFGRYATYVGSSPFEAPATLNLIAHVEREGVAIIEGGMTQLAKAVTALAMELGVVFRYDTRVTAIVERNGRAAGLDLVTADGVPERLAASAIVANADISTLASGALGPVAARACGRPTPVAKRSLSALTWAISGTTRGFPLAHHNVFFGDDYPAEHRALFDERRLPADPTVYVCAQDRTAPDAAPPGDERLFLIVNAPATGDGAPLAGDEVDRCETAMFSRLSRAGLSVSVTDVVRATPATFEAMAPGTGGAIYGEASHGPFSALSRPSCRTKLPGLLLASGSVHPGPGVPMAALSGKTAAKAAQDYLGSTSRSRSAATAGSTSTA